MYIEHPYFYEGKYYANILHFPDGVRMIKMLSFRYRCADVTRR